MLINGSSVIDIASTPPTTVDSINGTTTSILPSDSTETDVKSHTIRYLIIPICALGFVACLTVLVLLFLRKKRLDRLHQRLIPFYTFNPGEEDWETELLEDTQDLYAIKGYRTMENETPVSKTVLSSNIRETFT